MNVKCASGCRSRKLSAADERAIAACPYLHSESPSGGRVIVIRTKGRRAMEALKASRVSDGGRLRDPSDLTRFGDGETPRQTPDLIAVLTVPLFL